MMINVGIQGTKVDLEVLFFISTNVLWLRADGLTHTVLVARLIVTTVMGRNFFNTD